MIVKFWNDKLKIGFSDIHKPVALISGLIEHGKCTINRSSLMFIFKGFSKSYKTVSKNITHKNYEIKEHLPF